MSDSSRRSLTARTACAVAGLLVAAAPLSAQSRDVAPTLEEQVNARKGLLASTVFTPDLVVVDDDQIAVAVPIEDLWWTLDLTEHSVRSDDYQVYHTDAAGDLVPVAPGPVSTYRGSVVGLPGSTVAAGMTEDGIEAWVRLDDGRRYWIEPIARVVPDAESTHVIYRAEDLLPTGGTCGTDDELEPEEPPAEVAVVVGGDCNEFYVAELACDADYEYFQDWGGGTEARINNVINAVNAQYEDDAGVTHVITTIIVRTNSNDPYTAFDAFELLTQFRNQWLSQHGSIQRDVAHLFTGRNISGSTIGIAYTIGGICTTSAYCLSQSDCCGGLGCAADLTAHELGHLWNCTHCDPCNETMRSFIGCFQNFLAGSAASITGHAASRSCLDGGPPNYCAASGGSQDFISHVSLGDINRFSGADGYMSYPCDSTELEIGELHTIDVTIGSGSATDIGGMWIDFNHDEDFNDPDEAITTEWSGSGPYTVTFGLPADATLGETRMRVRVQDTQNPVVNPCFPTSVGEVEDYVVVIVDDETGPSNDPCGGAIVVGPGSHAFSTLGASTDGPPADFCGFGGDGQIRSDVWFRYVAPCTGLATVDVCTADFDTRIAIYDDCPIPKALPTLACNDDFCGTGGTRSRTFFGAVEGEEYLIRIGAPDGVSQGSGMLTIDSGCIATTGACCFDDGSCLEESAEDCAAGGGTYQGNDVACASVECAVPCPEDLDDSGAVDFGDLLAVLSNWGPCAACPEDLDDSGAVDFGDLLAILSNWGPC